MNPRPLWRIAGDVIGYVQLFREAPEPNRPDLPSVRNHLLAGIDAFMRDPDARAIPADEVEEARFALVAWIDEMINTSNWAHREDWRKEPLQLQLFQTVHAGNEFYEHLRKLRPDQLEAKSFYYVCLALGFQGEVSDAAQRRTLVNELYESLRVGGFALDLAHEREFTPSAYDLTIRLPERRRMGVWVWLLSFAVLAGAVFGALWFVLGRAADGVPVPPVGG